MANDSWVPLVSENLYRLRQAKGWTQKEAAEACAAAGLAWDERQYREREGARKSGYKRSVQYTAEVLVLLAVAFSVPLGALVLPPPGWPAPPGADPVASVEVLAKRKNMHETRFSRVALGQDGVVELGGVVWRCQRLRRAPRRAQVGVHRPQALHRRATHRRSSPRPARAA